jgi:nicotinamide riboside kinase
MEKTMEGTVKKIAITGPECSGKTTLCRALASHFNCLWVPEMARIVLEKDGPVYDAKKVEAMARMQLDEEKRLEKAAGEAGNEWLFCDTNLLVYQVWTEVKFGHCPEWILEEINRAEYYIQFLLRPGYCAMSPESSPLLDPIESSSKRNNENFFLHTG